MRSANRAIRRVLQRALCPGSRTQDGVGLIEVIIAIAILLVVVIPATYLIDTTVQQTAYARAKVAATELAETEMETLTNEPLQSLENYLDVNTTVANTTVSGISFKTSIYLTWQGIGSEPDLCMSGNPPQSISATATISWGPGHSQKLAEESVFDPPYSQPFFDLASGSGETTGLISGDVYAVIYSKTAETIASGSTLTLGAGTSSSQTITVSSSVTNSKTIAVSSFTANANYAVGTPVALPSEGYLGVQVNGVSGVAPTNVASVTVGIEPTGVPSSLTDYVPDSNGCVYVQEPPGDYTVLLSSSTSPPFIDRLENQSPESVAPASSPQVVSVGGSTVWTWTYDQASTVTFSASGGVPVAGNTPVAVYNSSIASPASPLYIAIPYPATTTTAYLFPFTGSYAAWYGDCLAEEPSSHTTVSLTPASAVPVSITGLADLTVEPVVSLTTPTATPGTVTAKVADPNSTADGCGLDSLGLGTSSSSAPNTEAGVVEVTRTDTGVSTTSASDVVTDPSILSTDAGKLVTGPGIPSPSYVTSVNTTNHTFNLWSAATTTTPGSTQQKATATSTTATIVLAGDTYSVTVTGNPTAANVTINPNGEVCTSGCVAATQNVFEPTGTPIQVPA